MGGGAQGATALTGGTWPHGHPLEPPLPLLQHRYSASFFCVTMYTTVFVAAKCSIEMQAYSYVSAYPVGFVKMNKVTVWQSSFNGLTPNRRGVSILVIDPSSCSVLESRTFDTYSCCRNENQLKDYLRKVSDGSVILGISADEPTRFLNRAFLVLRQLGVDVSDLKSKAAFAFVAQKGSPSKTMLRKKNNLLNSLRLSFSIAGILVV